MSVGKVKMEQALAGVKVLDFGWAFVGSLVGKYLADHGAQVVRVESSTHIDLTRTHRISSIVSGPEANPSFAHLNTSKYGMTINLKHPRAPAVIDRLVRWADVVNANFVPGTLEKLGFGYEYFRKIKPEIIMAEGSVYGIRGTPVNLPGVDGNGGALSGYLNLTGWPDREPVFPNAPYGDVLLPFFIAMAIVATVEKRRKTGMGQHIDASMFDVSVHQITPALLDWQANKHLQTRNGNRIAYAAPHGVFPCIGNDCWCAIAVFTDEEWEAFCNVLGNPPWTKNPMFATLKSRKANEDDLEKLIAEWTLGHSASEIMHMMQSAGVPAGVVQNARDIMEKDPQLKARGFLIPLKHPVLGVFSHPNPPFKLSKTQAQLRTAPCLGEHTEYVCTQMLGISDEEFVELLQQGVFE